MAEATTLHDAFIEELRDSDSSPSRALGRGWASRSDSDELCRGRPSGRPDAGSWDDDWASRSDSHHTAHARCGQ